ncbi:hypothetical protein [Clostridium estertheticum]|uniref:Uncharacterized protein n=1 Tax=Clostridium estertheticum TaxID=238834 RepID=A0AA47ELM6_9CLOT|nr:hypothetical protein [Clostridium estertheticum]MBU3154768.1 hypothetical protein [Clostridium estertheticum]WAG61654.1 hypothetical protein LL038_05265 [Clostridium estertheticum]
MNLLEVISIRNETPATKLGEDKLNYIIKVEEDDKKIYYRIYFNDGYYVRVVENESLLERIKTYTWFKEKNNNTIKSNSDEFTTEYLKNFLEEHNLPKYKVFKGEINEKEIDELLKII